MKSILPTHNRWWRTAVSTCTVTLVLPVFWMTNFYSKDVVNLTQVIICFIGFLAYLRYKGVM